MNDYNIEVPKGYKLEVRCTTIEDGKTTHIIASKLVGDRVRFFLFEIDDRSFKQITTSYDVYNLYDIIWPQ